MTRWLHPVNFLWLEDFLALASAGGFTRAAEARHMTQPAFSRRVRALEDWLGVELVDRSRQPIVLTEAGTWFAEAARDVIARIERMPDEARAVTDASAATLRIAATHALSLTFLPGWLQRHEDAVAPNAVELMSDVLARCEDHLIQGRVQFVLCHGHRSVHGRLDARFPHAVVGTDVLVPVSAPVRARASTPRYAMSRDAPMLDYSAESGLGRIVQAAAGPRERARGTTVLTAHLASVLKKMAIDGRGIAWLPESLVVDELRARRLVRAAPRAARLPVELRLHRSEAPLAPRAQRLWDAARERA